MDKKDLIKQCRYYKGEKKNPFELKLSQHEVDKSHLPPPECMKTEYVGLSSKEQESLCYSASFWEYERYWVEFQTDKKRSEFLVQETNEYLSRIEPYFTTQDCVPPSLKALLFNRFAHWHSGYAPIIEAFKEWYSHY